MDVLYRRRQVLVTLLPVFVGARRLFVTGLAGLLLGASAVACSGSGDRPRTLPPLSTTPAASASTAPSTQQDELAAATAVVRRYFAVVNALSRDMNAEALAQLMTPDCTCRQQVAAVRLAAERQEHYIDKATGLNLTASADGRTIVEVLVQYDASRGGLASASGKLISSSPPVRGVKRLFRLRFVNRTWLIYSIQAVS